MYVCPVCAWGIWRTFKALKVVNTNDVDGVADVTILAADDERWTMLKYWSVFSVWILYSAYAEWIVAWLPGYTILKFLSIIACFFMPTALRVTDTIFAYCLPPTLAIVRYAVHRSIVFGLVFLAKLFVFPDSTEHRTKREANTPYAAAHSLFLCTPCGLKTQHTRHMEHNPPRNDTDSLEDAASNNDSLEDEASDDTNSLEDEVADNHSIEDEASDYNSLGDEASDYNSLEDEAADYDNVEKDAAEHARTRYYVDDGEGLENDSTQHDVEYAKCNEDIDDDEFLEEDAADADNFRTASGEVGIG